MATLTVIVPTISRPSLSATIASVLPELKRFDCLYVIGDGQHGKHPYARGLCRLAQDETAAKVVYVQVDVPGSSFGNGQRDYGLKLAHTSHVCFVDDDDEWLPGAGELFRNAADVQPHAIHVFKARWGKGHHWQGVLWADREFTESNVGMPMCMWPRQSEWPRFMDYNDLGTVSDFGWMRAALGLHRIEWHEAEVAAVRP